MAMAVGIVSTSAVYFLKQVDALEDRSSIKQYEKHSQAAAESASDFLTGGPWETLIRIYHTF